MYDSFLEQFEKKPLDQRSKYLRSLVIRAFEGGMRGHLGSSMSLIEIIRVLYDDVLNFDVNNPLWVNRDRMILSKGHGCLSLYAMLAEKGFIKMEDLDKFCHSDGILGGHPERSKVPGVEASTGALGHGLSIGVGMALAARVTEKPYRVFVVTGDGEINEGSIWEAAMSAGKHRLAGLTWMIDYNKLQSYGETREVLDLEPLADKMRAFGFIVQEVDGHDCNALRSAMENCVPEADKPHGIICHTIKGRGFPFAEHNPSWHHKSRMSSKEIQAMRDCLKD